MLRGFVLFGDDLCYIGLVPIVALARRPGPALAPKLFVPSKIGVVFADPPDAKANGTVLIPVKSYLLSPGVSLSGAFLSRASCNSRSACK